MSKSPVPKRLKLDPSVSPSPSPEKVDPNPAKVDESTRQEDAISTEAEDDEEHCVICLQRIRDRTLLPCAHDRMCFECILVWTAQSRKCPLCNAPIGPFLIHNMRSKYDYQKRYLPPLRTSPPIATPLLPLRSGGNGTRNRGRPVADRWGTRSRRRSASRERQDMEDELELAVSRRKWVYRHKLYAKHVASNPYTRYRPAPTPSQIAASPDLMSRATIFIRRELRVWVNLDVEFLTTFILSLMKSLDLRSESAVKLLAEFLDMDTPYHVGSPSESVGRFANAEHFAHELYSYLRSPYRYLATYDSVVQYDPPEHIPPAPSQSMDEPRRWAQRSPTRAETFIRRRRRRYSSPSPLSRSPRDAYSRSPSPEHSYEERVQHPSRSANLVLSPRVAPSGAAADGRRREATNWDRKGKSKETAHPQPDWDTYRPDDNRSRRLAVRAPSRKRSRSPELTSTMTGQHCSRTSRRPESSRSPTGASYLPRSPNNCGGPSNADSPSKSTQITNLTGRRRSVDVHPRQDANLSRDRQPVPSPVELETTWGISIKGQAKLLHQNIEYQGEHHNPRDSGVSHADSPEGGTSQRGVQNINAQHAGLYRGSGEQEISPNNASTIDSDGENAAHETQNSMDGVNDENQIAKSAIHAAIAEGETFTGHSVSRRNNHIPSLDLASKLSTGVHRSAPEIMARTRAKIARLRGQLPQGGVESASNAGEGPCENTPEAVSLKARLLERLDEERRKASTKPLEGRDSAQGSRPKNEDVKDGSTASKVGVVASLVGEDIRTHVATDSRQVESKLRAQAVLRMRLAAERRRYEEETTSREDALRAKLLSRRA